MKHQSIAERSEEHLAENGIQFSRVPRGEAEALLKFWISTYAPQENINVDFWISKKGTCLWHLFRAVKNYATGPDATRLYLDQHPAEYFVFGTAPLFALKCTGKYVDFFQDDVYVCHHNMKWTMCYTHEINQKLGPYFAEAKLNKLASSG